jgi:hypothetical protein
MATRAGKRGAREVKWAVVGLYAGPGRDSGNPANIECVYEGLRSLEEAHRYMEHNEAAFLCDVTPGARFQQMWPETYTGQWWTAE